MFCPFKSNFEWRHLRDDDPAGWARAVEVDEALRREGTVANRNLEQSIYLPRFDRRRRRATAGRDRPGGIGGVHTLIPGAESPPIRPGTLAAGDGTTGPGRDRREDDRTA